MKKILSLKDTREIIKNTVSQFEEFVCSTMGPSGQNIAFHNELGNPVITKDGVSVAKAISFDDPRENLIADILKQAAEKTNTEAGDGTTTATALAAQTFASGYKRIMGGESPMDLKKEIDSSLAFVKEELAKMKIEFSQESEEVVKEILFKIAMISTNGDEFISKLISEAVGLAGKNGIIHVQKGSTSYELLKSSGMKIPNAGVVNPEYIRGIPDKKLVLNKCYILITTYNLENASILKDLQMNVIEPIRKANGSLLVISKKVDKGFLANLISFHINGQLTNAVVRPPYFGTVGREMMDDVAAFTGGIVIDEAQKHSFAAIKLEALGYAEKVEVTADHTILFQPKTNAAKFAERIKILEQKAVGLDPRTNDADKTLERLFTLKGEVYTIRIPSLSDVEDKERLDRVEDALNACRGALADGYLPGAGVALWDISQKVESKLMKEILTYPISRILNNAGLSKDVLLQALQSKELLNPGKNSIDARTGNVGDAFEMGIIDSYKVISSALANGVSVGSMLLTTTGIIANVPEAENTSPLEWDM